MGDAFDKSQRSVFVGNIPYEATEEKLKEIFSEVGPVLGFKLVYDRENGKPKGYGFCEYQDAEMAMSAMRNLNGYEIGGRTLRVDNACTEKTRMEMQAVMGQGGAPGAAGVPGVPGTMINMMEPLGQYGAEVAPGQAPESISKAVASLPPEQMFELMKQMKACIQNNPHEAQEMLRQNPQLAYALLQAQVVMRLVDPELALTMLHKARPNPPNFAHAMNVDSGPPHQQQGPPMRDGPASGGFGMPPMGGPPPSMGNAGQGNFPPSHGGPPPFHPGPAGQASDPPSRRDPREDRYGGGGSSSSGGRRDPRNRDPRASGGGSDRNEGFGGQRGGSAGPPGPMAGMDNLPQNLAGADPDKTQLIMQVLKLTDEQIAMLPAEQRASIMELKKQIHQ